MPGGAVAAERRQLAAADVVVSAVSDVEVPFGPADFAPSALVCDLSIPASVPGDLGSARPDVEAFAGGVARLPFGEDLTIDGFPLPAGRVYGCLAEAILLGLEGERGSAFTGPVTSAGVARVAAMADRHGIELAGTGALADVAIAAGACST
jgi:predicted amino acid dehydrogenase